MLLLFNQAIFNEIKIFKDINFISKSQTRDQRIQYVKRVICLSWKISFDNYLVSHRSLHIR